MRKKLEKVRELWERNSLISICCVLILLILIQSVVFWVNTGSFPDMLKKLGIAWLNILRNNSYAGIIGLGMCFCIISGGIDLSVGSMLCALGALLMYLIEPSTGLLLKFGITGAPAYILGIVLILAIGAVLGSLNGVLTGYGKVPPFIATLGTMKIFRSVTQQLTKTFNPSVPDGFKKIATLKIGGQMLLPIVYWLAAVIILCVVFKKTVFGRHTVSVGSNERASALSGLPVNKIKVKIYALTGLLTALATVIYVSRIGSMDFANAGSGYEMDAIAGAVVGGTSMAGGKGNILGAFLGMLIISVMNNILNSVGVPTFLCDAVKGAIIILAVLLQRREQA